MFIFDAHLDRAMKALEWNRHLARPMDEIRRREQNLTDKPDRGKGTVSLPEMRRGGIGLCAATRIARCVKPAQGRIWANLSNCRAVVAHKRQFSDEQIKAPFERGAMIGGALDAWIFGTRMKL